MSQMGPQVDVPVGAPETPGSNIGAWQGLIIKEILEKIDLSNIIFQYFFNDQPLPGPDVRT